MFTAIAYLQLWISARFDDRERGATAVEYGLMVGLIAVAVIGVVMTLGGQLEGLFDGVSDQLPAAPAGA
ncbi:Flp family type IVb pilin [Lentzea aerocolonigenes]|uniref:Flp family type IVb pilin n=1 Tax=Lentzea aerocolonigenes TaxID=68170 RepID=UPI00055BF203|nr:Flp family type IVb pilin [Lentzea aerocolonigenes]MCP2243587.1 pilus assembly protein Flp/PilA [Lentzea aerocolonigenes]